MARPLQTYPIGQQEARPVAAPFQSPSSGDFGQGQAAQTKEAAANIEKAGVSAGNIALDMFTDLNETRVQDLNNEFIREQQKALYTAPDAFYRKKGAEAISGAEAATSRLLDMQTQMLARDDLNPAVKKRLTDRLNAHVTSATDGISRHVAQQATVWQDAVAKGTVINAQNQAVIEYNDPNRVAMHAQGAWQFEYERTLKTTGDTPEGRMAAKAQADGVRSNIFKPAIIRLADENPAAAKRLFDSASAKGWLDATDAPALSKTINDAALKRRSQDIVSLVTATGGVSPNYNTRAQAAEGGSAFIENSIGALGKFQMTRDTYTNLAQETDWGKGKTQAEVRALLLDPKEGPKRQDDLQHKYNDRSLKALSAAGVPVNDLTLYTTHFLGHGAGPELLKLPDDTPLKPGMVKAHAGMRDPAAYTDLVYQSNPFLAKVNTVGDLKVLLAQKIGAPLTLASNGTPQKPSLDAMLAQANVLLGPGADPDLRDKTFAGIKTDYATKHAIYTAQIGALEKQAFAHIDAGGSISDLPPAIRSGLDGDSLSKVAVYEEKRLEKRKKENAEAAGKNLFDLERLGQLTVEDVEKQRNNLPEKEYRAWGRRATGIDRTDDPSQYERLQRGLGTKDMRDDIFSAFNAGDLSRESLDKLLDKNAALMKEGAPASPFKINHDRITRSLDPGLMGSGISREIYGRAVKEFDQYVGSNPMREGETPDQFAKRLDVFAEDTIKRHQLIKTSELAVSMPVPVNTPFTRADMTGPAKPEALKKIGAAYADLTDKLAKGQITNDQYNLDAIALADWLKFVQARPDTAPAPRR